MLPAVMSRFPLSTASCRAVISVPEEVKIPALYCSTASVWEASACGSSFFTGRAMINKRTPNSTRISRLSRRNHFGRPPPATPLPVPVLPVIFSQNSLTASPLSFYSLTPVLSPSFPMNFRQTSPSFQPYRRNFHTDSFRFRIFRVISVPSLLRHGSSHVPDFFLCLFRLPVRQFKHRL